MGIQTSRHPWVQSAIRIWDQSFFDIWFVSLMLASALSLGLAPQGMSVIPAFAAGLLLLRERRLPFAAIEREDGPFVTAVIAFFLFALAATTYAPNRLHGLEMVAGAFTLLALLALKVGYLRQQPRVSDRAIWWFVGLFVVLNIFLGLIMAGILKLPFVRSGRGLEIWPFNRAAVFSALLSPLIILAVTRVVRPVFARIMTIIALLGISGCVVFNSLSETAMLVYLVSLVTIGVGWLLPRLTAWGIWVGTAFGLLVLPHIIVPMAQWFLTSPLLDFKAGTVLARFNIWAGLYPFIDASPIVGNGIEYTRFTPFQNYQTKVWINETHPHSLLLQLWIDMGAVGVALFLTIAMLALQAFRGSSRLVEATYLSLLAGVLVVWTVSHGMWQHWWFGMISVCICLLVAMTRAEKAPVA